MTIKVFAVGLNYKGTDYELHGCKNDAVAVVEWVLRGNVAPPIIDTARYMTDGKQYEIYLAIAAEDFLQKFAAFLSDPAYTEKVFAFSGHGTWVADKNGDEADGRDEAICFDDAAVRDDELCALIRASLAPGCSLTCFFDSCHSGTVIDLSSLSESDKERMDIYCLSGCADKKYSADALIESKYQGAFTFAWRRALEANPELTEAGLVRGVNTVLRACGFVQRAQMSRTKDTHRTPFLQRLFGQKDEKKDLS